MASVAALYRRPDAAASGKNGPARVLVTRAHRKNLRQELRDVMARVHGISRKLAAYHVAQMEDSELLWRLEKYAEMELSAAGPNPRGVSVLLPGCHVPNDDGRLDGTQPHSRAGEDA